MTNAFVFPGQGSQFVGMGKDLADNFSLAREVFQEVDDALEQHLFKLICDGPESDLNLTQNTQPALMATSMAVFKVLEKEGGMTLASSAQYVAGHSLGEYSALCAAGSFSLADTARLLRIRGTAMQRAVPVGQGSMAAILGVDMDTARQIAEEAAQGQVCTAANDNADGQVVLSGHAEAIERAVEIAKEKGAKRSVILPVSAPFHCSLMQPAADEMQAALAEVTVNAPIVPVIANVTAAQVTDPDEIRKLLVAQVTGTVRWRESVLFMKEQGVSQLVELGAGKVLAGLTRRIDRELTAVSLQGPEDLDGFMKQAA